MLGCLLSGSLSHPLTAADSQFRIRHVTPAAPEPAKQPAQETTRRLADKGWNLRWRESDLVNEVRQEVAQVAASVPEGAGSFVRQAVAQVESEPQDAPEALPFDNPFRNPFGDPLPEEENDATKLPSPQQPPSANGTPPSVQEVPAEEPPLVPPNDLELNLPRPLPQETPDAETEPSPSDATDVPSATEPQRDAEATPSFRERMRQEYPGALNGRQPMIRTGTDGIDYSCEDLRAALQQRTIEKISLDISPPYRPDIIDEEERSEEFEKFLRHQPTRQWRNRAGQVISEGAMMGMSFQDIVINEDGRESRFPLNELSESDIAYITDTWGVPQECHLSEEEFVARNWMPMTFAWKASALCHNPLYFEEVNLERYGHTTGPFAQPVFSTAHFFVNIAVLPYKMGIHPPNECQYALGYYRPGNCAPWLVPPVPLSLRGALTQTGAVAAGVLLIP